MARDDLVGAGSSSSQAEVSVVAREDLMGAGSLSQEEEEGCSSP